MISLGINFQESMNIEIDSTDPDLELHRVFVTNRARCSSIYEMIPSMNLYTHDKQPLSQSPRARKVRSVKNEHYVTIVSFSEIRHISHVHTEYRNW